MTVQVGVSVIIYNYIDDRPHILMGKRKGSHGAGTWAFPGGHVELFESAQDTAFRELEEETGLVPVDLVSAGSTRSQLKRGPYTEDVFEHEFKHYITLFFTCLLKQNAAEVVLKEPEKCEEWVWCNKLPSPLFLPVQNLPHDFDVFTGEMI